MRKTSVFALALLLCLALFVPHTRVAASLPKQAPKSYVPGQVIIKFFGDAPELQSKDPIERRSAVAHMALASARDTGQRQAEPLMLNAGRGRMSKIISDHGLDRVYVLNIGEEADLKATIEELRARPDVEYAEPNFRVIPGTLIPDDPRFLGQWGIKNFGFAIDQMPTTANADSHIADAWEITMGSPDVVVAVTDTGVDITHPDLAGSIYTNPREIPDNGIDDDGNGYVDDVHGYNVGENNNDISDIYGHGTQMSGVIASGINNNIGVAGIAHVSIMPVRFFRKTGPEPIDVDASIVEATRSLVYAAASGASIVNASWRSLGTVDEVTDEQVRLLQDAVLALGDSGTLLVCIAGNEGYDNDVVKIYPGAYQLPNEITVAASDYNDQIWRNPNSPFNVQSGFGQKTVDLAAPGVAITSITPHGDCPLCSLSDNPDDWYQRSDGTSFSAAFVSGVAALVKSRYPDDDAIHLKARIMKGVDVLSSLAPYVSSSGRVNALGALLADVQITITPPTVSKLKFKVAKGKLVFIGTGIQNGARAIVNGQGYTVTPQVADNGQVVVKLPKTALQPGVPVPVKLRNPDGGESQTFTITK